MTSGERTGYAVLGTLEARSLDGIGNNPNNPGWGAVGASFVRIADNSYTDGVEDMARARPLTPGEVPQTRTPPITAPNPGPLVPDMRFVNQPAGDYPQPRDISDAVFAQPKDERGNDLSLPDPRGFNEFGLFFGQVQTHDTVESPVNVTAVSDFSTEHQVLVRGAPFAIQRTPPRYEDQDGDGVSVREQSNLETSFLDLTQIYGRQPETATLLRRLEADGEGLSPFLLSSDDFEGPRQGQNLLPTYGQINEHHRRFSDDPATAQDEIRAGMGRLFDPVLENFFSLDRFASGDQRVNQNAGTITQHTVWMRNHNHHAETVSKLFPDWTSEQVFNAARALNEAEYQRIQVNEYLPGIIGTAGASLIGPYRGYDPSTNPAIINEWTTVAFRFGHDQANNVVEKLAEDGTPTLTVSLRESFSLANNAAAVGSGGELDEWIRGQVSATAQAIDGFTVEGNRNDLFGVTVSPVTGLPVVTDLTVFDMVRGRDHGVNDYGKLREAVGLRPYAGWDDWAADNNVAPERVEALRRLYGDEFGKLEAYVGGLLEKPWQDSSLGETFTRVTALQYAALRDGDRFYYENRLAGSPELLAQVNRTTMADILERNTGVEHVYREAFRAHERIGGTVGDDTLQGTEGRDLVMGFGGNDRLFGLGGNDDLYGDAGRDLLAGGRGDDLLVGGAGDDLLAGGEGSDVFEFLGGSGRDVVLDFERGRDRLDLTDYGLDTWAKIQAAIRGDGPGAAESQGYAAAAAELGAQARGWFQADVDPRGPGGGVVLDIGNGDAVVLLGVPVEKLTASDFVLFG